MDIPAMTSEAKFDHVGRNLDVLLGLAAWSIAFINFLVTGREDFARGLIVGGLVVPAVWLLLVIMALRLRRRPLSYLWWIWPGAPLAFKHAYMGLFILTGGFAFLR